MKKFLCIIFILIGGGLGFSQELNVHIEGNSLESLLPTEQLKTLKILNITGKLTTSDYAFLCDKRLKNIETLNLRYASIDSIPPKAFQGWSPSSNPRLILPEKLKFIGDYAFSDFGKIVTIEITGNFPKCGEHILESHYQGRNITYKWEIASDNTSCKIMENGLICSSDDQIVYNTNNPHAPIHIPEGISIIAPHAFEDCTFTEIILPESIDSIGNSAFYEMQASPVALNIPIYQGSNSFICKAVTPPILCEKSLELGYILQKTGCLYVPDQSLNLYKATDGWNSAFEIIAPISELKERIINPDNIHNLVKTLKVTFTGTIFTCTSPSAIQLEIYTPDAVKVGQSSFRNGEAVVKVDRVPATYLYIVTYPDGRRESGKVMVK